MEFKCGDKVIAVDGHIKGNTGTVGPNGMYYNYERLWVDIIWDTPTIDCRLVNCGWHPSLFNKRDLVNKITLPKLNIKK